MDQIENISTTLNRVQVQEIATAAELHALLPLPAATQRVIRRTQESLKNILHGNDDRLALIVGPCSIHDAHAALEFAQRLMPLRSRYADALEIVMRVYFEKPRTTVGWKGWINDPLLDGSFRIGEGLGQARKLLLDINGLGLPAATEFLDLMSVRYLDDLISWGAIGARTTESQMHRQVASGLSAPIGFKNGTDGNVKIAIDAVKAARESHHYLSPSAEGRLAVTSTFGNNASHIVLRGGKVPNYDNRSINAACADLLHARLPARLVVDASHGNSGKSPLAQIKVCENIAHQLANGEQRIAGVMLESHLVAGRQEVIPGEPLRYGQSITDACIGWSDTARLIELLADAVRERQQYFHASIKRHAANADVRHAAQATSY